MLLTSRRTSIPYNVGGGNGGQDLGTAFYTLQLPQEMDGALLCIACCFYCNQQELLTDCWTLTVVKGAQLLRLFW